MEVTNVQSAYTTTDEDGFIPLTVTLRNAGDTNGDDSYDLWIGEVLFPGMQ